MLTPEGFVYAMPRRATVVYHIIADLMSPLISYAAS